MFKPVILIATLFVFAGCSVAPQPVYRAQPVAGSDVWANGAELSRGSANGIEVVMTFEESRGSQLVFQVEVLNWSEQPVTVDPTDLFLSVHGDGDRGAIHIPARDPEAALLHADLNRARAVAIEESRTGTDLLLDLLEISADLATRGADLTEAERQTLLLEDQQEALDDELLRQEHERTLQSIDESKGRWAGQALRKTTVPPGYRVGGEVLFRAPDRSGPVALVVPVGEDTVRIPYEVIRHVPGR